MNIRRRTKDLRSKRDEELLEEMDPGWAELAGAQKARGRTVRMTALYRNALRRNLNTIVFPDRLYMEGLSLAALLSMPRAELVGVIPEYQSLRSGDVVTALMFHRPSHRMIIVGSFSVCEGEAPITIRYSRETLSQFGANGMIEFTYEVRNDSGDITVRSPPSALNVMLHGMPARLMAPMVMRGDDGIVRESDIVPELVVQIPIATPACKGGDRLYLRMGDAFFEPLTLGKLEATLDPMAKILLRCDDILRMAAEYGTGTFELDVAYDIERDGILSPSAAASVAFDLSASLALEHAPPVT